MNAKMTKIPPRPIVPLDHEHGPTIFQGKLYRKPWHYLITAVIPTLNQPEETAIVCELLRLQTCRPYILLIDTGSNPLDLLSLALLRADDCELHVIARQGMQHPCDSIASALDLGFSLADTPYVFTTHQDCFLRSRHFLQDLVDNIHGLTAIGYRLSPRQYEGWDRELSHTATLWRLADYDRLGLSWSLRRAAYLLGRPRPDDPRLLPTQTDTETCINHLLQQHHAPTKFCGTEENFVRNLDENIDHPRSTACSRLYGQTLYPARYHDCQLAMADARARIAQWKAYGPDETPNLPEPPKALNSDHTTSKLPEDNPNPQPTKEPTWSEPTAH
jgi:hypothetical protein